MKKANLDEMQEQKVLKMESIGHGIAFWGLLAAIVIQVATGAGLTQIIAEWAVFMVLCGHMIFGCLKHGIWSCKFAPSGWINLFSSLGAGAVVGAMVWGTAASYGWSGIRLIKVIAISFGITFAACILLLTVSVKIYKNRRNKLDSE